MLSDAAAADMTGNAIGADPHIVAALRFEIKHELERYARFGREYGCLEGSVGKAFNSAELSLFKELSTAVVVRLRVEESAFQRSPEYKHFLAIKLAEREPVSSLTFFTHRIVGLGGFGEVYAMKRVESGKVYAVKVLNKSVVKRKHAEDLCINERTALQVCRSPFVVNLLYAFQTKADLFLVLDMMSGGDLCYHLNKSPTGRFPPQQARFHAVEIMLGLRHIHEHGYVYRDLKPDNVLLCDRGHCKISDLGLAISKDKPLVFTAGTLGYMAPEMFRRNDFGEYDPNGKKPPYDHAVDWWSYGCLVFEILVGKCPFRTMAAKTYYERLFGVVCPGGNTLSYRYATCSMEVEYNSSVFQSPEGQLAASLIKGCLKRNRTERFGSTDRLYYKLKHHAWFADFVDVGAIARKEIKPIFVPRKNKTNAERTHEILRELQKRETVKLNAPDQLQWASWSYCAPNAFQEELVELMAHEDSNGPVDPPTANLRFCSIM